MLQIYDMGPTALLPLRRKACWGLFRPKNPTASDRFEPANLGTKGKHATPKPPKPLTVGIYKYKCILMVIKLKKLFFILILTFKWKIYYTEISIWLQFTINFRKSHSKPQCRLQLVCEGRRFFVWVDLQVCWRGQQHTKLRASNTFLVYTIFFFFFKLRSSSNPTNKNLTQ